MLQNIDQVQFGLLSSPDIHKLSVVEITNARISTDDRDGTVYDARMGPMNPTDICPTCNLTTILCVGHFGHIRLRVPIIHPMYYKRVMHILQCICLQCSQCLLNEDHMRLLGLMRYKRESRFSAVRDKIVRMRFCTHCNAHQPDVCFSTLDSTYSLLYTLPTDQHTERVALHTEHIYQLLDRISDADVELMGLCAVSAHPRNLILECLPVLPPRARPYIDTDTVICDDDLTIQYTEIIKANVSLGAANISESRRERLIANLVFWVRTLMDNSKMKARHNNAKPMKGIKERLSSKDGIIRCHLMGKRTDQSARTVIGPDPTLRVNEIAVPHQIADVLTFPVRVFPANLESMQDLVMRDGANIVHRGHRKFTLEYALAGERRHKFRLQVGDLVHRKLQDGDMVIVNRQPSLHHGSMMAKKVVRREGKTIRLNLAVTASFNADFDKPILCRKQAALKACNRLVISQN